MSVTEQQLGHGRPDAEQAGRRARASAARVRLRPVVAAGVVLLLWFAWLLVPSSDPDDASAPAGDEAAATDGLGAQVLGDGAARFPDEVAQDEGDDATVPSTVPSAPAPVPTDPAATGPAAADPAAAEPTPVVVPQAGQGTFAVAPGGTAAVGSGGTLVTYTVEVEDGVPVDVAEAAAVVDGVLADPRSWTGQGEWSLQRTDTDPDVHIRVTSPDTTDRLCAPLRTRGQVSCRNGDDVVLNALRWTQGANAWGDDVVGYREYLVNHELGHYLGYGHVGCPVDGEPAPVMLQQTLGLQGCAPNGWPFP